ncbi:DNA polymerase III subunit gamma/tau [Treponema primitia]|nr:DNA polymerase III subunit gamma/tau [Treponema primitia]
MAYEVTATKRRPKTFDELAGQDFVAATLKSSIETGRIAHAYLFSGPRGCGKTSAARILARSLNCEKGPTVTPCGECPSCREITRGASLDIIEIDGASNNSVNDVRQIKDEVIFPPQGGRKKIYIIDEVHMLSQSAFNALLKTIEEPPEYIVFIFATTEVHKVPATIRSRCQQFNFRLIPIETIQGILKDTCAEMGIEAEDEALFWIAKESTGSLRDAYTLFDQVASFSEGHIRSQLIRDKLGLVGLDKLNALAESCAANDTAGAFAQIDEILDAGIAIEQFVIDLAGYYRSLLLLKNGVTRESLLGFGPDRFSALVQEKLDSPRLEQALSLLLDLYRDIRYSVSPRFELETAVSKLCWLDRWVSPLELRAAIAGARNILDKGDGGGIAGPLAGPGSVAPAVQDKTDLSRPGAFVEGFKRVLAAREAADAAAQAELVARGTALQVASDRAAVSQMGEPSAPGAGLAAGAGLSGSGPGVSAEAGALPGESPVEAAVPCKDLPELREALIKSLRQDRGLLASGLDKSLPWEWAGANSIGDDGNGANTVETNGSGDSPGEGKLRIPVQDPLTAELIKKDSALIRQLLGKLWGKPVLPEAVQVPAGAPGGVEPEKPLSPQAEMVRRMFRGTVVKTNGMEKNDGH